MRLIDISEFPKIRFQEAPDPRSVCYAILSHVWNKKGGGSEPTEPDYSHLRDVIKTSGELPSKANLQYAKLRGFCETAYKHGYKLVWADMCCIDKNSSAELSEAIASMYHWYHRADVCYAYLQDVSSSDRRDVELALLDSEWFERGWTLQELIAPRTLIFLDEDWRPLGTKSSFANHIMSITHILPDVLTHRQSVYEVSVAQRMSWAAGRKTTRPEDQAYCLMGLFGIRIPIMYGEGTYAFVRLQEEILRVIPDPSLLAWGKQCDDLSSLGYDMRLRSPIQSPTSVTPSLHILPPLYAFNVDRYFMASSPDDFVLGGYGNLSIRSVEQSPSRAPRPFPFQIVPCHILRMRVPLIALYPKRLVAGAEESSPPSAYLAFLGCRTHTGRSLALLLSVQYASTQPLVYMGSPTLLSPESPYRRDPSVIRIVTVSEEDTPIPLETEMTPRGDVYLPVSARSTLGDPSHSAAVHRTLSQNGGKFHIKQVAGWCGAMLATNQYFLVPAATSESHHAYRLSLPLGYETCPHEQAGDSDPQSLAAGAHLSPCPGPEASGTLNITFANCESTVCGYHQRMAAEGAPRYLWGDIHIDTAPTRPSQTSGTPSLARSCPGPGSHLTSWKLRDGIASKTFAFRIRRMQEEAAPASTWTSHALLHNADSQLIHITLALKPSPSEHKEGSHSFLLEVDVSKQARRVPAMSAPSPTRAAPDINLNLLIPNATSFSADRGRQSPLTRRNSLVISRVASAAGDADLLSAADAVQRRVRSSSLSREPSGAPSIPSRSTAVPILITPVPIASESPGRTQLSAVPPSPIHRTPVVRHPPPFPPMLIEGIESAPDPLYTGAGPSTRLETSSPTTDIRDQDVDAPTARTGLNLNRGGSAPPSKAQPHPPRGSVFRQATLVKKIRSMMSKWGWSRPKNGVSDVRGAEGRAEALSARA